MIQLTATDQDLSPDLTYEFLPDGNPDMTFSIDRYSGKVSLTKPLDYEHMTKYLLKVLVSSGEGRHWSLRLVHMIISKRLMKIRLI